jgi:hypothetical protein
MLIIMFIANDVYISASQLKRAIAHDQLRIAIPGSRTFSQSRNPGIGWLQSRDFRIDNLVHFYEMITVSSSILATAN